MPLAHHGAPGSHTRHRASRVPGLLVSLTGAPDKFLDVLPTDRVRLVLTSRGLSSHLLKPKSHRFAGTRVKKPRRHVRARDGRHIALDGCRLLSSLFLIVDECANGFRIGWEIAALPAARRRLERSPHLPFVLAGCWANRHLRPLPAIRVSQPTAPE